DPAHRVHQLRPAAVVDGQAKPHARVRLAEADVLVDLGQHLGRQSLAPADGAEADVPLHDLFALREEILVEEGHEEIELALRSFPVFGGETVERQLPDAEPAAFFDGGADAADALAMSLDARQVALPGPAAVAVHDDGDMARQAV